MTGTDGGAVRLLRVYAVWIVLVTAVVIAAAVGMSLTAPRAYRSEAIVVVESRVRANTTPVPPDMGTEKELARSGVVLDPAALALGISQGLLLEGLTVGVATDANVLTFTYTDENPAIAQNRAESVARAYVRYRNSGEAAATPTGAATTSTQHATLVTDAVVSSTPIERSTWISVGVGLAIGLLLGVGTAVLRDRMSDRIRGRADFERISGTTVLATVPRQRKRRRDGALPVILRAPESPAAESFRYLRSRLQPQLRGATTILVTSAGGREGRTTTAANLAVAMAQAGLKVVLIDADLRAPRLHTVFGNDNAVGLTSVLAGEGTIKQAMRETSVPGLRLLTGGPIAGNAGDLLVQSRLRPVLDAVAATCDLVILDSGAVLDVSDPIVLAAVSDHVLLVGDCRLTTRKYVARALAELAEVVHGNVSGVLLNAPRRAGAPHGRPQHGVPVAEIGARTPAAVGSAPVPQPATPQPATPQPATPQPATPQPTPPRTATPRPAAPKKPNVYSSASASTPIIPGHAGDSGHPSGDLPMQTGDRRRRLIRRG